MDKRENKFTPQQYKKYNGQSIMAAFKSMGDRATVDDISGCIARTIHQPEECIREEVANVLNRGVSDGFLLKREQYYILVNKDTYQTDFKVSNVPNVSKSSETQGELAELKERQRLRNDLEMTLYKMSTEELRKLHNLYVQQDN